MTTNDSPSSIIQDSLGEQFIQNSKVHINLSQDVIVITEDRFRLCLIDHVNRLAAKERWLAPVSLFLTLIIVFATSTFRDFVFPAATWQAVFLIGTVASAIWSAVALIKAFRTNTKLDTLVSDVKKSSKSLTQP
jgi:hypothetical protein